MGGVPWSVPVRILAWPEALVALEARAATTPVGEVVVLVARPMPPGAANAPGAAPANAPGAAPSAALAGLALVRGTRAEALAGLVDDLSRHADVRGRLVDGAAADLAGPAGTLDEVLAELVAADGRVGVLTAGTAFARAVMAALVDVPEGRTVTYGELAERAGAPRAARAVGTVMARALVPLVVPCHRVVPASGGVGAYGPHPRLKRTLLELEGALA